MSTGANESGSNGPGSPSEQPPVAMQATPGAASLEEEDSGLIDIKKMARHTKRRVTARMSTESDVEESLLASSRPSALRDVVLPTPGEDTPNLATEETPVAALAGPGAAPAGGAPWVAIAAAVVLLLGGVVAFLATRAGGNADSTKVAAAATAPTPEAQPAPAPAVAPAAAGAAKADLAPAATAVVTDPAKPAASDPAIAPQPTDAVAGEADTTGTPADLPRAAASGDTPTAASGAVAKREHKPAGHGAAHHDKTKKASKHAGTRRGKKAKSGAGKAAPKAETADLDALLDNASNGAAERRHAAAAAKSEKKSVSKKTLSRSDITKGMGSVRGRVQRCYEKFQKSGSIIIKVSIANAGTVSKAKATGKFKGTPTGKCVVGAVKHATFPEYAGRPTSVSYPFLLSD